MGGFLCREADHSDMAAKNPDFGMHHPTVVPANFDPDAVPSPAADEDATDEAEE